MLEKNWPIALGFVALLLWILYAGFALSVEAPDWIPGFAILPAEDGSNTVLARRGQFGDAFGAFNALVSTFALIGLLFTIRSQQSQIETQIAMSKSSDLLIRQQQFQEQYYRAVDAYRELLAEITFQDSSDNRITRKGRVALWAMWRQQLISVIGPSDDSPLFKEAISRQLSAYEYEDLGRWNENQSASDAIEALLTSIDRDSTHLTLALQKIGSAWAGLYIANRFQLDSLFRAWYTAYRVLATAKSYEVSEESIRLYSAVFRAQLSWIEMAFLLADQSCLPSSPRYPRACHISNVHAIFDNLDSSHDAVVAILVRNAHGNQNELSADRAVLCSRAFGTDCSPMLST